ncbi:uncharacterized mitochondrial protein AtMg00810-like [Lactuca sativa]|uniref:uncharacterized mitochondrial protein AtMg00810-like n=1 Tax=Lactuca sativa TaxID=4236 RepID=UPI000CD834B3|nr:uncharacterized mitochondrial protein AtMg00810-like [Lactuca sativa]
MKEEMHALHTNDTWSAVPWPKSSNIVGSNWVFHTKCHSDGSVDLLKAQLVAQGFTQVTYNVNVLFLSQEKYDHDVLVRAGLLDSKPIATPLSTTDYLSSSCTPLSDQTTYRCLVNALQYLTITRFDLLYVVNQVSQFPHVPTTDHFQALKRILRYVKGMISFGLSFTHSSFPSILGYSDTDWARCLETRRSTYGYSIFLDGNLISWSAKKQPTVSRSSCESEYRSMANTIVKIVWVTHLLREHHVVPPDRPTLLCDNQSVIFLS